LPSPNDLKGKILVKARKIRAGGAMDNLGVKHFACPEKRNGGGGGGDPDGSGAMDSISISTSTLLMPFSNK
jgi:hypothetical protein